MSNPFYAPSNSDYLNAINATKVAIDKGSTDPAAIPSGYTLLYSSTQDPVNAATYVSNGLVAAAYGNPTTGQS